ncbi:DMT family transporter [Ancylobacter terrae]|uniref:DMT family transporter n=1 Tax=Ancylobacter sp. sgz301288 TaxID=3342077 RepID=UPI0038580791
MQRVFLRLGPLAVAIGGIGLLSIMDGMIKHATFSYGTGQVVVLRYAFGALVAFAVFRFAGTPWPSPATIRAHGWRAVVVVITAVSFFYALATLPLAVALALSFTSPIFIALFARIGLGERPSGHVAAALTLGLLGVVVVLWDELQRVGGGSALGIGASLVSAIAYALSMVALKHRTAHDPITTIVMLQNVLAMALAAPLAAVDWRTPEIASLAFFAVIGLIGAGGHLCLAWAYGRAEANRLAVMEYTSFVWAALIGLFVFGEVPSLGTVGGAGLIICGAALVSRAHPSEPEAEIGP